jgi:hypothetical protein
MAEAVTQVEVIKLDAPKSKKRQRNFNQEEKDIILEECTKSYSLLKKKFGKG